MLVVGPSDALMNKIVAVAHMNTNVTFNRKRRLRRGVRMANCVPGGGQ